MLYILDNRGTSSKKRSKTSRTIRRGSMTNYLEIKRFLDQNESSKSNIPKIEI